MRPRDSGKDPIRPKLPAGVDLAEWKGGQLLGPVLSHAALARKRNRPPACADLARGRGRSATGSGGGARSDLGRRGGALRTLRRSARYGRRRATHHPNDYARGGVAWVWLL